MVLRFTRKSTYAILVMFETMLTTKYGNEQHLFQRCFFIAGRRFAVGKQHSAIMPGAVFRLGGAAIYFIKIIGGYQLEKKQITGAERAEKDNQLRADIVCRLPGGVHVSDVLPASLRGK